MTDKEFYELLKEHRKKTDVSELQDILTYKDHFDSENRISIIIGSIPKEFEEWFDIKDAFFVEGLDNWVTLIDFNGTAIIDNSDKEDY